MTTPQNKNNLEKEPANKDCNVICFEIFIFKTNNFSRFIYVYLYSLEYPLFWENIKVISNNKFFTQNEKRNNVANIN